MTENQSKSRREAEIAFGRTQMPPPPPAESQAVEELRAAEDARTEKTRRLREARLAMASKSIEQATAALITKRARKG